MGKGDMRAQTQQVCECIRAGLEALGDHVQAAYVTGCSHLVDGGQEMR